MKSYIGVLVVVLILFVFVDCRHQPEIPDSPSISFSKDIQPIMISNCAQSGCHDGFSKFGLTTYVEISKRTSPGNAHQSSLYTSIVTRKMPPSQPLSDQQTKLIYTWIMQGSKDN